MIALAQQTAEGLFSLLFPRECEGCARGLDRNECFCATCAEELPRITGPHCRICSQPFYGSIQGEFTCANCEGRRFHFTTAVAAYRSRGVVRNLVHRFKYDGHLYLRRALAELLLHGLADDRLHAEPIDALVPVPLHPVRRRTRGFNQAEVLARALTSRCGIPTADLLRRIRATTTQTRLDREERMENLRGAFQLRHTAGVKGKRLLLIDDVLTTGSTLDECARVLCEAGAESVLALVVARG
jgi:competence protein ComFC